MIQLDLLLAAVCRAGYQLIGPSIKDGAIVYDEVSSIEELPVGWTDDQEAGRYRLQRRDDRALFGYVVGPQSWKKLLHPPRQLLWKGRRTDGGLETIAREEVTPRRAFLAVRACEIAAIGIQDRVFTQGQHADPIYAHRREQALVIAVNCTEPAGTCFCSSLGTGPEVISGFDLALTEMIDESGHWFMLEVGTDRGGALLEGLEFTPVTDTERRAVHQRVDAAARQMGRALNTKGLKKLLYDSYDHPRWDDVADRCLACSNCTMVCPTCFCTTVEDVTELSGEIAERWRRWDSCFTLDFSHLSGGSVRHSTRSRYRQWMTHKLATWQDQFDSLGCVGCGRCITWCPVGIDITEEVRQIRAHPVAARASR
ncbi:MAG: 4Fe-4S dicluster domain-containing protein [Acidobacteriota bacterium]|nr:MAG: 4Fe-4S dicluster domain-containing protein [Acidobacteriota bacterium]